MSCLSCPSVNVLKQGQGHNVYGVGYGVGSRKEHLMGSEAFIPENLRNTTLKSADFGAF